MELFHEKKSALWVNTINPKLVYNIGFVSGVIRLKKHYLKKVIKNLHSKLYYIIFAICLTKTDNKMKTFTADQKEIMNVLTDTFNVINIKTDNGNSILNLKVIRGTVDAQINWKVELDAMKLAFSNAKKLQIDTDINSIKNELESLGLRIIMPNNSMTFTICPLDIDLKDCTSMDRIKVAYQHTELLKYEKFGVYGEIPCKFKPHLDDHDCYDTFLEMVQSERFTKLVEKLYFRYLDRKNEK